jgi:hypothetical protein
MKNKPGPKADAPPITTEKLREYAGTLLKYSRRLRAYAEALDDIDVKSIAALDGAYNTAIQRLQEFLNRQVLPKVAESLDSAGYDAHERLLKVIEKDDSNS